MRRMLWGLGFVFLLLYAESRAASCSSTLHSSFCSLAGQHVSLSLEHSLGRGVLMFGKTASIWPTRFTAVAAGPMCGSTASGLTTCCAAPAMR